MPKKPQQPTRPAPPPPNISLDDVQYAIPSDMCAIGDTRHPLHKKPLPKRSGPHYTDENVTTTWQIRRK